MCEYILRKIQECATSNILIHMRQHVQNANAFQANAHKENASMYDTQYFGVYETTYGSVSAGREKWPFNVLFFLKVEPPCDQT